MKKKTLCYLLSFFMLVLLLVMTTAPVSALADTTIYSAKYTVDRNDRSLWDSNGELKLEQYYDNIVLESGNENFDRINLYLREECDDFLSDAEDCIELAKENPYFEEECYQNYADAEVTQNADGIFSVKMTSMWYLGGVGNKDVFGLNFNLNTGEFLNLTDVFSLNEQEIERYLKEQTLNYIYVHPDMAWWDDSVQKATDVIQGYSLGDFNYYIQDENIVLCYRTYELGPGSMGHVTVSCPIINSKRDITVVLNGDTISFDQPPIMENDRILVPIRGIAEAMGDDVDWNQEMQTAFINHPERALIIPLNQDHLYIAKPDTKWDIAALDVPSQVRGGRTLVPVRAFCESLGADFTWDGASNTAYITYGNTAGAQKLDEQQIRKINAVYACIADASAIDFKPYIAAMIDYSAARDNLKKHITDTLALTWSDDLFSGVNQLLSGEEASKTCIKAGIAQILTEMTAEDDKPPLVHQIITTIGEKGSETATTAVDVLELGGEKLEDLEIKSLNDLKIDNLDKLIDTSDINNLGDLMDISVFTVEQIAEFLADYSQSESCLQKMLDAFENIPDNDKSEFDRYMIEIVKEMQTEYSNGWLRVLQNVQHEVVEKGGDLILDELTGGVYGIVDFAKELTVGLSGLGDKVDGLYGFYGANFCSATVQMAYTQAKEDIVNSVFEGSGVSDQAFENFEFVFGLEQETLIQEYSNILKMVTESKDIQICTDEIKAIKSMSYMLW